MPSPAGGAELSSSESSSSTPGGLGVAAPKSFSCAAKASSSSGRRFLGGAFGWGCGCATGAAFGTAKEGKSTTVRTKKICTGLTSKDTFNSDVFANPRSSRNCRTNDSAGGYRLRTSDGLCRGVMAGTCPRLTSTCKRSGFMFLPRSVFPLGLKNILTKTRPQSSKSAACNSSARFKSGW